LDSSTHLDPDILTALLEGGGFLAWGQLKALRQHLEAGCPACDAFLASEGQERDKVVELLAMQETVSAPARVEEEPQSDAQEAFWDDFSARLGAGPETRPSVARTRRPSQNPAPEKPVPGAGRAKTARQVSFFARFRKVTFLVGTLSAAAMLYLYVRPSTSGSPEQDDGRKSQSGEPGASLPSPGVPAVAQSTAAARPTPAVVHLVVIKNDRGAPGVAPHRLSDGATVPGTGSLVLHLQLDPGSFGFLFAIDASGQATRLWPNPSASPEPAAADTREDEGPSVELPLEGRAGTLVLLAAASRTTLDPESEILADWKARRADRAGFESLLLHIDDASPAGTKGVAPGHGLPSR
jgi:hypothetical protein